MALVPTYNVPKMIPKPFTAVLKKFERSANRSLPYLGEAGEPPWQIRGWYKSLLCLQ